MGEGLTPALQLGASPPLRSNSPRISPWGLEDESQHQLSLSLCCVTEAQGKPVMCADHTAEGKQDHSPPSKPPGQGLLPDSPDKGPQQRTPPHTQSHGFGSHLGPARILWPIIISVLYRKKGMSTKVKRLIQPGKLKAHMPTHLSALHPLLQPYRNRHHHARVPSRPLSPIPSLTSLRKAEKPPTQLTPTSKEGTQSFSSVIITTTK